MTAAAPDGARAVHRSSRYVDELFRLRCRPWLVSLFPNAKEVTETFAAWRAVREHLCHRVLDGGKPLSPLDDSIVCVVPGDGTTLRTGATIALRSAWNVYSVDPSMAPAWFSAAPPLAIRRLTCLTSRPGSGWNEIEPRISAPRIVVVAVHSHAPLSAVLAACVSPRVDVVSLPCCVPDDLGAPDLSFEDPHCWSPKRTVNVYRGRRGAS